MPLALSTSWNAFRHNRAAGIIREIKAIGFRDIELSFNLTPLMVKEIGGFVEKGQVRVASLHNYCPIPAGLSRARALPDCYSMSSADSAEREKALKYTKATIDAARRLGAETVVLHCGRVEIPDRTRDLISLCRRNRRNSPAYRFLKKRAIEERKESAEVFLKAALKSLEELERYARKGKIKLGIETRFYYREIPSFEETGFILRLFQDSNIFYWHDCGHAQLMQELGFVAGHRDYLEAYGRRLLGIHLHDIAGCQDHLAPGRGILNFSSFKPYLKKDTLKVIEAHAGAGPEDLKKSVLLLERILDAKS